jgi:hypothetical protein
MSLYKVFAGSNLREQKKSSHNTNRGKKKEATIEGKMEKGLKTIFMEDKLDNLLVLCPSCLI